MKKAAGKLMKKLAKSTEPSSSQPKRKKRQLVGQDEEEEDERTSQQEDMEVEQEEEEKPEWRHGISLHSLPRHWQLELFRDKIGEAENMKRQLLGERRVEWPEFKGFGFIEAFEKMGWKNILLWNNNDDPAVNLEGIIEWMGTLERQVGNNPPETTKLVGTVDGKKVTMSFVTLDRVTKFDLGARSGRAFDYLSEDILTGVEKSANWLEMVAELFTYPIDALKLNLKLDRAHLKPLPRLIMNVLSWNVCPRSSDKAAVRFQEVVVLYALVTERLALSLRQIIMTNIWETRNKRLKMLLPYPRLISRLILLQKAATIDSPTVKVTQTVITMRRLLQGSEWRLENRPYCRILSDLKSGGRLIAPKEEFTMDQVMAQMEPVGGNERGESSVAREVDEEGEPQRRDSLLGAGIGGSGPSFGFERPGEYDQWTSYERSMWDMTAQHGVQRRSYELAMAYAHEQDRRNQFDYFEQVRHHQDHSAGLDYVETPPPYDYRQRFDPASHPAYPQSHDSEWFPRHSCVGRVEGSSSDPPPSAPDPFDGRSLYQSLMESVFGPQGPRQ